MRRQSSLARHLASAALTAVLAAGLGGCQTMSDVTGSLTSSSTAEAVPDDPRRAVEVYGERYRKNPKDVDAALAYGQALRATGQRSQAAAMLEQATIANPGNRTLLAAYGRALADNELPKAEETLRRAYGNSRADPRVRQNLALVVGLQGRFAEAESIVKADLPADEAAANVAYLRDMLSRKDNPRAASRTAPVVALGKDD